MRDRGKGAREGSRYKVVPSRAAAAPQRGMAGSVGHLQGGWLEPHVSEQTRVPSISFVFCHITAFHWLFVTSLAKRKEWI